MPKTKAAVMSAFEVSPELVRAMDEIASKQGVSRSAFIRSSIEAAIRTSPGFKARLLAQLLRIFQALVRQAMGRKLISRAIAKEVVIALGNARAEIEKSLSPGDEPSGSAKRFARRSEIDVCSDDLVLGETEGLWRLMDFFA